MKNIFMEPIEFAWVAIAIPFLNKSVENLREKLGENRIKQLAKLWKTIRAMPENTFMALKPSQDGLFPENFEAAIKEIEKVANQNWELKQDIIDVIAFAEKEHSEDVKNLQAECLCCMKMANANFPPEKSIRILLCSFLVDNSVSCA